MKLPSYLVRSRHGVFYFRQTITIDGKRRDTRVSLHTKNPAVAKVHAIRLSAMMIEDRFNGTPMDFEDLKKRMRKFEAQLSNDGSWKFKTDPNDPHDVDNLARFVRNISPATHQPELLHRNNESTDARNYAGTSINEVADRYQTRHAKLKAAKTLYEYRNYHSYFIKWLERRKNFEPYPIRLVTNADISIFIDDLMAEGKSAQAIQTKYLGALNALFEFSKTIGAFPKETQIPTRGHKIFNKSQHEPNRKSFTQDELKEIFKPENLHKAKHPEQFWLPLLGLFTGGRISELTQLTLGDFRELDGIWSISINDEDHKKLKTKASRRTIPVHPQLLEIGLMDYVADMQQFNGQLFPELVPDQFGHFGKEPSRRFGTYLDKLGITDRSKVFHSFRTTSNNCLKQAGVPEETRCQFVGHEHDTINSSTYGEPHNVRYLLNNVATKLVFDIDFNGLHYNPGQFDAFIRRENHKRASREKNIEAKK